MAGDFFTSEHAVKVTNLVSQALGGKPTYGQSEEKSNNIFSGFLRLLGFESMQISAIAVNAIILVAQLVGLSLKPVPKLDYKMIKEDRPFNWMMNNSVISHLFADTEDDALSEKVIKYVTERSVNEETGCIQLLICKMKPFVTQMQRSIKEESTKNVKGYAVLYEYFPNASIIAENGDRCEKKYYYCGVPL